jgi:hypothetical protein
MAVLRDRLEANGQSVEGTFSRKNAVLCMRPGKRRFWSPCLDLTLDGAEDPSADVPGVPKVDPSVKVWGTFSPRPEIWTAFVFAIGVLTVLSVINVFFGIAQFMSGQSPGALLIPVVAILVAAALYASALIGQGLSGDDMYRLRAYLDDCLDEAEEQTRRDPELGARASAQL